MINSIPNQAVMIHFKDFSNHSSSFANRPPLPPKKITKAPRYIEGGSKGTADSYFSDMESFMPPSEPMLFDDSQDFPMRQGISAETCDDEDKTTESEEIECRTRLTDLAHRLNHKILPQLRSEALQELAQDPELALKFIRFGGLVYLALEGKWHMSYPWLGEDIDVMALKYKNNEEYLKRNPEAMDKFSRELMEKIRLLTSIP